MFPAVCEPVLRTTESKRNRRTHSPQYRNCRGPAFDLTGFPLAKPPIAALLEHFDQFAKVGIRQFLRRGIFRQHSQGRLAKDGGKQSLILQKDTVQDRDGLPFQITGHVHQVGAVAAQFLQYQRLVPADIAGGITAESDDIGDDK